MSTRHGMVLRTGVGNARMYWNTCCRDSSAARFLLVGARGCRRVPERFFRHLQHVAARSHAAAVSRQMVRLCLETCRSRRFSTDG